MHQIPATTGPDRTFAAPLAAALAIVALALVLRLEGARGELWIDEVWTLSLLTDVAGVGEIVWGINHDNNHILNSVWLYLIGPDAAPIAQRGLSIVFGALSAGVAFRIGMRRGMAEGLAAALLFAATYPMVYFGSEARGYAGLILLCLCALVLLEREFTAPAARNRLLLGVALALAVLSQFIALAVVGLLGFWTAWRAWRQTKRLGAAEQATLTIFLPTLVLLILLGAAILYGAVRDGFAIGNVEETGLVGALDGYGRLVALLLGMPPSLPAALGLVALAAALLFAALVWGRRGNDRLALHVAGLAGLPALMIAAGLPNLDLPRYFLPGGILFLLLLADLFGAAWRHGGGARITAVAVLTAILVGNAAALKTFYETRRSHFGEALALMAEETPGRPLVFGADQDFRATTMVGFLAPALGLATVHVPGDSWCATPPDWLLYDPVRLGQDRTEVRYAGADCELRFERRGAWPGWGLSDLNLAVARRVP